MAIDYPNRVREKSHNDQMGVSMFSIMVPVMKVSNIFSRTFASNVRLLLLDTVYQSPLKTA
jgi:hypothetical protein